jgi:hypothetical protein
MNLIKQMVERDAMSVDDIMGLLGIIAGMDVVWMCYG